VSGLPPGWETSTITEVSEVIRGVTFKKGDAVSDPAAGYVPILRATNINSRLLLNAEMTYVPERFVHENQRLHVGDIVLATSSGSASVVGKSAQLQHPWEGAFGAFCGVIRPHLLMAPGFLAHYVASARVRDQWREKAQGTNINNLKTSDIASTEVPIPPRAEQERIVAAIEEQFSRLESAEAGLEQTQGRLNTMKDALVQMTSPTEECNGKVVSVQDTIRVIDYRGRTPPFSPAGIPHLRTFNVRNGQVNWERCAFVTEATYGKYMSRGLPAAGDLLFTTEAPMGEVAFAPQDKFCMAQRMMLLKPDPSVWISEYLMYHLQSPWFQARLRLSATGTTVQGISSRNFRPLALYAPPLNTQSELALRIGEALPFIDRQHKAINRVSSQSTRLRASILTAAFSGQLVPQDPAEEPTSVVLDRIAIKRSNRQQPIRGRKPRTQRNEFTS
jgi:type I restriction enzyme, S subunit